MTGKFAYPRFSIEREIFLKFKAHCVENDISVENGIRKLIVRYMKHNKLIDDSYDEDKIDQSFVEARKEIRRKTKSI